MSNSAVTPLSLAASRAESQAALVAKLNQMNADADQAIADMIADSAANARAIVQESATGPGVGTQLDRKV